MNKKMLRQAQEMQNRIAAIQQELAQEITEATAGGNAVKATVIGGTKLQSLEIKPNIIDPDDPEMLEELIMVAVNEAFAKAQESAQGKLNFTGMM